jgi:hypothetical protein
MISITDGLVEVGTEEGNVCNRDGCKGVITYEPVNDCYCHISPPCLNCIDNKPRCPECGWEED